MSKFVWGTFSVKDHRRPDAFVAEVMLYDRLVIPIPPDAKERLRWERRGWEPERLDMLLQILGDRAYTVEWDIERQATWRNHYEAGSELAHNLGDWAFQATRNVLTQGLPPHVTGIQVVPSYTSLDELRKDISLRNDQEGTLPVYGGAAVAILGHEFLVPDDPRCTHEQLIREAVDLSSDPAFRRKRDSFWHWQRKFFNDQSITDQSAIVAAIEEMRDLLDEEKKAVRKMRIHTGVQFACLIGSITLGVLAGPLTPIALGGAFLSVGQFAADRMLSNRDENVDKPVALLRDTRRHFGWER